MAPSLPTSPTSPSPSTFPSPSASTRAGSCSPSAPWCTWYRRLIQDAGSSGMPPFESRWCNDCRHIQPRRRTDQYRKRQQKGRELTSTSPGNSSGGSCSVFPAPFSSTGGRLVDIQPVPGPRGRTTRPRSGVRWRANSTTTAAARWLPCVPDGGVGRDGSTLISCRAAVAEAISGSAAAGSGRGGEAAKDGSG